MPRYLAPSSNPYRASTGSMPIPTNSSRNPQSNRYTDSCSSCGSSYTDEHTIPINTPFSGTPGSSTASLAQRRMSSSEGHRPVVVSGGKPTATATPPPGTRLQRYPNGALVYEPASSIEPRLSMHGSHGRRGSFSTQQPVHMRTYLHPGGSHGHGHTHRESRSHRHHSNSKWESYQHDIDIRDESHGTRGRTKIPRRLVNKEAVQEVGLPYEVDEGSGAIVIFRALSRHDIEKLVHLTNAIRSARKEKHEKHVRIIPEPTKTAIIHNSDSTSRAGERSREVIIRAEERADAAHERALKKEYRAETSGSFIDGIKARKARAEADEQARVAEEIVIKERRKREEREKRDGSTYRVSRHQHDAVIVR